jgi:hypothetical protein
MPERPPTATAFRAICSRAPEPKQALLPEVTPIDQARAERLRDVVCAIGSGQSDPRGWARRVIERHESRERIATPAALAMARQALARRKEAA